MGNMGSQLSASQLVPVMTARLEGRPGMGQAWGSGWGSGWGSQNQRKTNNHRPMGQMGHPRGRNSAALHSYTTVILI